MIPSHVRTHWARVVLTSSGIMWGVALLVALTAAGQSLAAHYREKTEAVGPKIIYVFAGAVARPGAGARTTRPVLLDIKDPPRLPGSHDRRGSDPCDANHA